MNEDLDRPLRYGCAEVLLVLALGAAVGLAWAWLMAWLTAWLTAAP